jgi:hypothetical protein
MVPSRIEVDNPTLKKTCQPTESLSMCMPRFSKDRVQVFGQGFEMVARCHRQCLHQPCPILHGLYPKSCPSSIVGVKVTWTDGDGALSNKSDKLGGRLYLRQRTRSL